MGQVSHAHNRTLLSLPFSTNRSALLLSGALLGAGLTTGGVWLTDRSVALIPAGALLGATLAWAVLKRDHPPVQIGQFTIFNIQGEGRDAIRELVRGWGRITFEKELDLCLKKYESLNGTFPPDTKDERSFAQIQLFRSRQLPPQECAHHANESSYIVGKLEPEYDLSQDPTPWDTLLTSVDSTGTVQAVALYSERNNRLVNLVTHPNNIPLPEGEEPFGAPTRGAGSSVMHYLLHKSLRSNRPLTLEPTDSSIPFFKKFGLQEQPRAQGALTEMKISPEEIRSQNVT